MKKGLVIFRIVAILILMMGAIYFIADGLGFSIIPSEKPSNTSDKTVDVKPAPLTPPSSPSDVDQANSTHPDSKKILDQEQKRLKDLESFTQKFLTDFFNYSSSQPVSHIERIKNRLQTDLYEMLKEQYKVPFEDTKSMSLVSYEVLSQKKEEQGDIELSLQAVVSFVGANGESAKEPQFVSLNLEPYHDSWKVRWLYSGNASD